MKSYNRFSKKAIKTFMSNTYGYAEYYNFLNAIETLHDLNFIDNETHRYIHEIDCHLFNSIK